MTQHEMIFLVYKWAFKQFILRPPSSRSGCSNSCMRATRYCPCLFISRGSSWIQTGYFFRAVTVSRSILDRAEFPTKVDGFLKCIFKYRWNETRIKTLGWLSIKSPNQMFALVKLENPNLLQVSSPMHWSLQWPHKYRKNFISELAMN